MVSEESPFSFEFPPLPPLVFLCWWLSFPPDAVIEFESGEMRELLRRAGGGGRR